MATKNYLHQFSDFFENISGSNCRNCRFGTEGRYRFFLKLYYKFFDYTIIIIENNFITSKTLFGVAQLKQKILLLLLKEVLGHVNDVFNEISSFKHRR